MTACATVQDEGTDAMHADDELVADQGTESPELQAYKELYGMVLSGCERTGARAARITVPWEQTPTEVRCADVAERGERGIIGAILGVAVIAVSALAESWCDDHNKNRKGTKQDAHCHYVVKGWEVATVVGLAFVF
jgi:hypothetical protein